MIQPLGTERRKPRFLWLSFHRYGHRFDWYKQKFFRAQTHAIHGRYTSSSPCSAFKSYNFRLNVRHNSILGENALKCNKVWFSSYSMPQMFFSQLIQQLSKFSYFLSFWPIIYWSCNIWWRRYSLTKGL